MTSREFSVVSASPTDAMSRAFFEQFSQRLIGLARVHLGDRLRRKVDPEDVVESAYKSLLIRYGEAAVAAEGWDALWGLLTLIQVCRSRPLLCDGLPESPSRGRTRGWCRQYRPVD